MDKKDQIWALYQSFTVRLGYYAASSGNFGPETSERNYHFSLRHNPEESSSHLLTTNVLRRTEHNSRVIACQ